MTLVTRDAPVATSCITGYPLGRFCDRESGHAGAWYEACFHAKVNVWIDDTDGTRRLVNRPASLNPNQESAGTFQDAFSDEGFSWFDDLSFGVNSAGKSNGQSGTCRFGQPSAAGHCREHTLPKWAKAGSVTHVDNICPNGAVCIQAHDDQATPHVFCKSVPAVRYDRQYTGDGTTSTTTAAGKYLEPFGTRNLYFKVDVVTAPKRPGGVTSTNVIATPTVITRQFYMDNLDTETTRLAVVLYDPVTMQLIRPEVIHLEVVHKPPNPTEGCSIRAEHYDGVESTSAVDAPSGPGRDPVGKRLVKFVLDSGTLGVIVLVYLAYERRALQRYYVWLTFMAYNFQRFRTAPGAEVDTP